MGKLQDQSYIVLKPIKYKGPGKMYRQVIKPADNLIIKLDHLPDEDIQLLMKMRYVAPASAKEVKQVKSAQKAIEAEIATEKQADTDTWEAAKKQALDKMANSAPGE